MAKLAKNPTLSFVLWAVLSLSLSLFHEPWRDEAQAWLVAVNAHSFGDLLFRSAMEGTGPVYYLILWPFARAFPESFPFTIFFISWVGTAAAVLTLFFWKDVPWKIAMLVAFGYLFGYEFPVIARLYGWGSFFLLYGMRADLDNRKTAPVFLSLACLTQLNFLFAVFGWCAYRSHTSKKFFSYGPVIIFALIALLHLQSVSSYSQWNAWALHPKYLTRLGTLLSAPFVHLHGDIGLGGLLLFPLALLSLSGRARVALIAAIVPYLILFLLRYPGNPRSRHAGGIFLLWIVLSLLSDFQEKKSSRYALYFFLTASFALGIAAMGREILQPFSHSLSAAKVIETRARELGRPVRLYNSDPLYGYVVAARLNVPLWTHSGPLGCPFFPGKCTDTLESKPTPDARIDRTQCLDRQACFFVSHSSLPPFPPAEGKWVEIFRGEGSIVNEDIATYEWSDR